MEVHGLFTKTIESPVFYISSDKWPEYEYTISELDTGISIYFSRNGVLIKKLKIEKEGE